MKRVFGGGRREHEQWHQGLVFMNRQRLCEEISEIVRAFAPLYIEMTLSDAIANPMKTHIDRLELLGFHSVGGDANGTGVVAEHYRGGLRETKRMQNCANPLSNPTVGE